MSVLSCCRRNWENIMCDRVSYIHGYICEECFVELINSDLDVGAFMKSEKVVVREDFDDRREWLERVFPKV